MPGWVCLVLLGMYLIYSSALGFDGWNYLKEFDDFGLGLVIFLSASGIPLGFVIHKTTFFLRWTSPFLCTRIQNPAMCQFVGCHSRSIEEASKIHDHFARSESNKHWPAWFEIDAVFSSRIAFKDISDSGFDANVWDSRGRQLIDNMQGSYAVMMGSLIASGIHSIVALWNTIGPGIGYLWSIPFSLTALSTAAIFYTLGGQFGLHKAPVKICVAAVLFAIANWIPVLIPLVISADVRLAWLTFSFPPTLASLLLAWIFYRSGRYYHDHIAAHYRFAIRQIFKDEATV